MVSAHIAGPAVGLLCVKLTWIPFAQSNKSSLSLLDEFLLSNVGAFFPEINCGPLNQ